MNRKKVLIILGVLLILIVVPIMVLANKKIIRFTEEGKVIISSPEEKKELEDGTEYVLAVPTETPSTRSDEEMQKEKQKIVENIEKMPQTIDTNIVKEPEEVDSFAKEREEKRQKEEEEFKKVFIKYYGQEELDRIFNNIKQETTSRKQTQYTFPKKAEELLDKSADIIKNENSTEEEKEAMKVIIEGMDLLTLDNEELRKKLVDLGIAVDGYRKEEVNH